MTKIAGLLFKKRNILEAPTQVEFMIFVLNFAHVLNGAMPANLSAELFCIYKAKL